MRDPRVYSRDLCSSVGVRMSLKGRLRLVRDELSTSCTSLHSLSSSHSGPWRSDAVGTGTRAGVVESGAVGI